MTAKPQAGVEAALPRMFLRSLFLQSAWNFERMQNLGFLFALEPALKRIWKDPADRVAATRRHLEVFNTQPYMAGFCLGATARLEAEMAAAPKSERPAREARLRSFKAVLSSTCAALGDPFFWSALRPFCAVLALGVWGLAAFWVWYGAALRDEGFAALPAGVFLAGSAAYLALFNGFALTARAAGLRLGWREGEEVARELKRLPLRAWEARLRWTGFLLTAAAALGFLTVSAARGDWWVLVAALGMAALKVWDFSTVALYACILFVSLAAALIRP